LLIGEYILQSNNGENNSSEFLLFDENLQLNNISELNVSFRIKAVI
jgi:hypothetical protein